MGCIKYFLTYYSCTHLLFPNVCFSVVVYVIYPERRSTFQVFQLTRFPKDLGRGLPLLPTHLVGVTLDTTLNILRSTRDRREGAPSRGAERPRLASRGDGSSVLSGRRGRRSRRPPLRAGVRW